MQRVEVDEEPLSSSALMWADDDDDDAIVWLFHSSHLKYNLNVMMLLIITFKIGNFEKN